MQVSQMKNEKGNVVKNQMIINYKNGAAFQSYDSLIAYKPSSGDTPILSDNWDYSATTIKHLKLFLNTQDSKAQIQKRIDAGSLILMNETDLQRCIEKQNK